MVKKMAESITQKGAEATSPQEQAKTSEAPTPKGYKAIVLGATGATGRYVVGELLACKVYPIVYLGLGNRLKLRCIQHLCIRTTFC